MQIAGTFSPGVYREGASFLHRFDPRLKLVLLLGLVACLFSASSPLRLLLVFVLWFAAASGCQGGLRDSLKVLKLMRWLLLFALLLHLFLTPGRTLFGSRWLSYDGLLRGLMIDGQLLLAIFLSLLLAWTTRPELLAWAFARLLSPLQVLRVPVQEAVSLLLLVLHFFPLIQAEVVGLKSQRGVADDSLLARLRGVAGMVGPLLFRLLEHADRLAVDIAQGKDVFGAEKCSCKKRVSLGDLWLFVAGLLILLLLWMV